MRVNLIIDINLGEVFMMNVIKRYARKLFSDLHSALLGIIISAIFISLGGIWVFSKRLWNVIKPNMIIPTPLWLTIIIILSVLIVYVSLKKIYPPLSTPDPKYREEFHVYWDENNKMRCLNCGKPLKYSSSDTDPSIFFCSDPRCNSKHILKDKKGRKITEQQAIEYIESK